MIKKISFLYLLFSFVNAFAFVNDANLEQVKFALAQEFKIKFPKIVINDIEISANSLPRNFQYHSFIRLAEGKFDRANGYLRAEFKSPENIKKNVFFRYFLRAKLQVLRSNKMLQRGDKLNSSDYFISFIDFDKVPLGAISPDDELDLIARTNVKKNAILKQNMFKTNHLVKKNTPLKGILKDGDIRIIVELNALESGNKGDTIKVRNKDGKVLQAVIISKNQVSLE